MSIELLKKQLKTGELEKLYLLYGEEDYLKAFYCSEISRKTVNGMESFNLHVFYNDNFSLSQLKAAIDNLPLMSDRKCIILRDIDPDGLKADEWKELQQMLKSIPAECVIILHFVAVKYDKKSSRWKTLISIAQKAGMAIDIGRLQRRELVRWLGKKAAEKSCTIPDGVAEYLMETIGEDMTQLICEMDKLCAFTGSGEIAKSSVDALAARPLDASIYDLAKYVTTGRTAEALRILDELFYRKEEPVVILAALSGTFCDLYRAKTAKLAGARQTEIEGDFSYRGKEFRVRNALRDCSGLDINFLRKAMELMVKADESIKSSRIDNRVVLERLIVEIAG